MCKLNVLIMVLLINGIHASAQYSVNKQMKIAERCLNFTLKGPVEDAWQLFDRINFPEISKEQFITGLTQIKNQLSVFDTFAFATIVSQKVNDKIFNVYRYQTLSKSANILTNVFVTLIFVDTSESVGGIQVKALPKDSTSLTSKNKETPIVEPFTTIIESVTYKIRGINVVHFNDNLGMLAIQVERKIGAEEFGKKGWTTTEAVKFAKFLLTKGYVKKASLTAQTLGLHLLDDLGVSFIDPDSKAGVNVKLSPADFNN